MTKEAKPQKSTIYLDAEDEITAIIDKVKSAHGSIVAVVPPKRAAALQSVVNLRLLQKAARSSKKNLVLVTTESALLPLAGTVGLMVAKTTSSKPEVPPAPKEATPPGHDDDEVVETGEEPSIDPEKSVGELAAPAAAADAVETVELDDPAAKPSDAKKGKKSKQNKKLKVPNFNTFRKKMILVGCGLLALIFLFILANVILPKASIKIKTDTASVEVNLNATGSTSATEVNTENLTVPMQKEEFKQTDSQKVAATGKKNVGETASGSVVMEVCAGFSAPDDLPAGTGLSSGGKSYVTKESASFSSDSIGSGCIVYKTNSVGINASEKGSASNVSGATFQVAGSNATATGSASGGTDKTVTVVSQSDVNSARQKILDETKQQGEDKLSEAFQQANVMPLKETLKAGDPVVTSSPNVGDESGEVNVTVTVTYEQYGVKRDDVTKLIEADATRQIDTSNQQVQDSGIDSATLRVTSSQGDTVKFQVQSIAQAGPLFDIEAIKKEIAGKKRGETTSIIMGRPGVKDVEIDYSPFWVFSTPRSADKINIMFESVNADQ
jgi:hypothetical protein